MTIRLLLIVALMGVSAFTATAQDETAAPDTTWDVALTGMLSGAQAGFQNWAEGGVNTLAFTTAIDGAAKQEYGRWKQKHDAKLSFGLVKQDTLDFRKAEDLIRVRSSLVYRGDLFFAKFKPTVALGARSQFAPGFNFDKNPIPGSSATPPVKVSDFMAPGVFSQTLGLTYAPREWITQRFGISAKETVVAIEALRPLYNVSVDKAYRAELGLEAFTEFDKEIATNVRYKSTLGLFANFNTIDAPDILWENLLAMKVNSWLSVNVEWTTLLDRDVSNSLQLREVFSVGVSYAFL